MNDVELVELATRFMLEGSPNRSFTSPTIAVIVNRDELPNPLLDNGAAFVLAVWSGLFVDADEGMAVDGAKEFDEETPNEIVCLSWWGGGEDPHARYREPDDGDFLAFLRRGIVRAAADKATKLALLPRGTT